MKKNLPKIIMLLALAVLVGKATLAVWSDTAQSTGNTFQAGTLDLKLSDSDQAIQDNVSVTWSGSAMTPGGTSTTATLKLRNVGDPAADHVHLLFANLITPGAGVGVTETATDLITKHLQVVSMTYDGANLLDGTTTGADSNGNGYFDLQDLEAFGLIGNHSGTLASSPKSLDLTDLNNVHELIMTVQLNSDAPDENQGDLDTMTLTATLHQVDGQ